MAHKHFDGRNGLRSSAGVVEAVREGEVLASARSEKTLEELLSSYGAVDLFPELEFSLDGSERKLIAELELSFSLPLLVFGAMSCGNERALWEASRVGSNTFLQQDQLPQGARPWASKEEKGRGWEIILPAFIAVKEDAVMQKRAALAIEALIYSLQQEREIQLPYKRVLSNVFSKDNPMWDISLPLVRGY